MHFPASPSELGGDALYEEELLEGDGSASDGHQIARRSLKKEAHSLYHLLTHKPKNPYCESCRRATMKESRQYAGSYKSTATRWGELVTGDHIASTQDNMLGIQGSRDIMVIKDAYSGLKSSYPMPDKSAESTIIAIKHFQREREFARFYSDRSSEIEKDVKELRIPSNKSQPSVPQNNAVAERLVQDVLEGTRTALVRAGLPPCFW
ncbi:MAG: hypothetical protein ACKPKO_08785, partial [Candidatus Fonsibacter sp.]